MEDKTVFNMAVVFVKMVPGTIFWKRFIFHYI